MTPTARSLALLRSQGWVGDIVERWIGGGKFHVRKDFLGFADLVLLKDDGHGFTMALAVQATSGTNVAHRVAKMLETPEPPEWLPPRGPLHYDAPEQGTSFTGSPASISSVTTTPRTCHAFRLPRAPRLAHP